MSDKDEERGALTVTLSVNGAPRNFYREMENSRGATLAHQKSMIEVPQAILDDLELPEEDDDDFDDDDDDVEDMDNTETMHGPDSVSAANTNASHESGETRVADSATRGESAREREDSKGEGEDLEGPTRGRASAHVPKKKAKRKEIGMGLSSLSKALTDMSSGFGSGAEFPEEETETTLDAIEKVKRLSVKKKKHERNISVTMIDAKGEVHFYNPMGEHMDEIKEDAEMDSESESEEKEESRTTAFDASLWQTVSEGTFEECDIRFDDDDFEGKKPEAETFRNLQFFFQFVYDRFHHEAQIILDTTLPDYNEWKKMRKVRGFRTNALRDIDHALKSYVVCVDTMRAMVKNCLLLCYDPRQAKRIEYEGWTRPKIEKRTFACGVFSVVSAWDLFTVGNTPTTEDWQRALNHESPAQYLGQVNPDFRYLTSPKLREKTEQFHMFKKYQHYCLAEYLSLHLETMSFGHSLEWKKIKNKFLNKSNAPILSMFDYLTFYVNPKIDDIANLMADRNSKYNSSRRIVAEPFCWLVYLSLFLLDRQKKLWKLVASAGGFAGLESARFKGQKIQVLISNLAKSAKEESDRLQKLMAKLPSVNDLSDTFKKEIAERDASLYCKTFDEAFLVCSKENIEEIRKKG